MKGENLLLLNRADEAAVAYGDFIAKDKEHPKQRVAAFRIAQIFHGKGEWAKALASARPLLAEEAGGNAVRPTFLRGWRLPVPAGEVGGVDPAARGFRGDLRRRGQGRQAPKLRGRPTPNVDTALMQLVVAHVRGENAEKALQNLKTLTETYPWPTPQLPMALAEQGRLAFEAGDLKLARQALQRFFAEAVKNEAPFNQHAAEPAAEGRLLSGLGGSQRGQTRGGGAALLAEVPNAHELAADARLQQGIALVKAEKFEESAKLFPEMLKQFPSTKSASGCFTTPGFRSPVWKSGSRPRISSRNSSRNIRNQSSPTRRSTSGRGASAPANASRRPPRSTSSCSQPTPRAISHAQGAQRARRSEP
jgi:tetratricopeptide (TPR) repeat protein